MGRACRDASSTDPVVPRATATEVQAAGRIHRLGQTKDVLIKRFAFRNSLEDNIIQLHAAIKAGTITITDGHIPAAGMRILNR